MSLSLHQYFDDRIDIVSETLPRPLSYRWGNQLPKPAVHPIVTPRGHVLSGFEMSDHVWHRGLWYAIKLVNGTNFWEERPPFGIQTPHGGEQPRAEILDQNTVQVSHLLDWTSEATGVIAEETRQVIFRQSGEIFSIDWMTELRFTADVVLDRTPYTTWGGYGGMSFRAARTWHKGSFMTPNGQTQPALAGQRHDWVIMQGLMDDGVDQKVSVGMIDHPSNPRAPTSWYAKCADFTFMNAAFLFHEPMPMKKAEPLRSRYRILWRDGSWKKDEFAQLAEAFRSSKS